MPPVSSPFKHGALIVLMNYNDHDPPHVHIKYQSDVRSYRIEIRTQRWMKPGRELPAPLKRSVEQWVAEHASALLEQWERAAQNQPVTIIE